MIYLSEAEPSCNFFGDPKMFIGELRIFTGDPQTYFYYIVSLIMSLKSQVFIIHSQICIRDLKNFNEDPSISSETFNVDPLLDGGPYVFVGDVKIFIGDPPFSFETPIRVVSTMKHKISSEGILRRNVWGLQ